MCALHVAQPFDSVFGWSVSLVDREVADRAQQHQVVDAVDIFGAHGGAAARPSLAKRADVCLFTNNPDILRQAVFPKRRVAAIELAPPGRNSPKEDLNRDGDPARDLSESCVLPLVSRWL